MVLSADYRDDGSGNRRWSVHHFNDGLCIAEKGFPFPQRYLLLHLLYQSVFCRSCALLPDDDTDLSLTGQLLCSASAAADVLLADHSDEELCEGNPSRDHRVR